MSTCAARVAGRRGWMDRREQDAVVGETAVVETSHIPRRSTATFGIAHPSRSRLKKVDRRTRKNGENRVFWETNMLTECQSVSQSLPHSCKRRRGRQRSNIEGTPFSRLRRPIRLGGWDRHGKTARSALYLTVKVAGGGTSVRAHLCLIFVPSLKSFRCLRPRKVEPTERSGSLRALYRSEIHKKTLQARLQEAWHGLLNIYIINNGNPPFFACTS